MKKYHGCQKLNNLTDNIPAYKTSRNVNRRIQLMKRHVTSIKPVYILYTNILLFEMNVGLSVEFLLPIYLSSPKCKQVCVNSKQCAKIYFRGKPLIIWPKQNFMYGCKSCEQKLPLFSYLYDQFDLKKSLIIF